MVGKVLLLGEREADLPHPELDELRRRYGYNTRIVGNPLVNLREHLFDCRRLEPGAVYVPTALALTLFSIENLENNFLKAVRDYSHFTHVLRDDRHATFARLHVLQNGVLATEPLEAP